MREPVRKTTPALPTPSPEARTAAASGPRSAADHAALLQSWDCLTHVELYQPAPADPPDTLTIAAWNIERCKRVPETAELLRSSGADIVLATEMDFGMARSGQHHTTRDLAEALGMGYAFGVEFVELGTGDPYETGLFADVPNTHGLHGNAILSRYPMENVALLPLEDSGHWFTGSPKGDGQFRIGGRMAMAAEIGGVTYVSVHYESESDAAGRADQTRRLLDLIQQVYGDGPCVIGGDLNTAAFSDQRMSGAEILANPALAEPSFVAFAVAGFGWQAANAPGITTRAAPGKPVRYPLKKLDWLFVRGATASAPAITPATCDRGDYLSDHELISARIAS
ncbi:MAG: endonuclease/exonuclease/phosphatase family protein [Pseudomonadota bacterium]